MQKTPSWQYQEEASGLKIDNRMHSVPIDAECDGINRHTNVERVQNTIESEQAKMEGIP